MANTKISALTSATTPLAGTEVLPIVQSGATVKVAVTDLTAGRAVSVSSLTNTGLTASKPVFTDASKVLTSTGVVPVANGGTNASAASITAFNNITGYTAAGATGTTSTNLVFSTSPSVTTPTLVGDVTVSTGNVVIGTSGKGIDFSATPGTGTSELLADYEEGTWTPSIGGTATYTLQNGTYVKVGNFVMAQFRININVRGTGSQDTVSGLPFTSENSFAQTGAVSYFANLAVNVTSMGVYAVNNGTSFQFTTLAAAGATTTAANTVIQNSTRIDGFLIYRAA